MIRLQSSWSRTSLVVSTIRCCLPSASLVWGTPAGRCAQIIRIFNLLRKVCKSSARCWMIFKRCGCLLFSTYVDCNCSHKSISNVMHHVQCHSRLLIPSQVPVLGDTTIQHPYLYNLRSLNHLGLHTVTCNAEEAQKGLGGPVPCMHINFCTQDTSPAQLHVILHVTGLRVGRGEEKREGEGRDGRRGWGVRGRGREWEGGWKWGERDERDGEREGECFKPTVGLAPMSHSDNIAKFGNITSQPFIPCRGFWFGNFQNKPLTVTVNYCTFN